MGAGGPGLPGGGGDPGGGGENPGSRILQTLAGLQQQPSPSAEETMLFEATVMVNGAYARVAQRNSKVGEHLMKANGEINKAMSLLKSEVSKPMNQPPDFGMPATGAPTMPAGPTGV
jgi:hypothetical protein